MKGDWKMSEKDEGCVYCGCEDVGTVNLKVHSRDDVVVEVEPTLLYCKKCRKTFVEEEK